MQDALLTSAGPRRPPDREAWRSAWDRLHDDALPPGEALSLLDSLSLTEPVGDSLTAWLASLEERRPAVPVTFPGTVNIVGTGGGPRTFNISTAAAFVAAAMGTPVIKTGSRAFSGSRGSVDLLELLGIPLTTSYEQTREALERRGIAFAGYFVYPRELGLLMSGLPPLERRKFGRLYNALGPFLATMPVSAQVTGVSDRSLLPGVRQAALRTARTARRRVWLCTNETGVDELLSFTGNVIRAHDAHADTDADADADSATDYDVQESEILLSPGALGLQQTGQLDDLSPARGNSATVEHFRRVLSGRAGPVATQTVCLNAAALAAAAAPAAGRPNEGRHNQGWPAALRRAHEAMLDGAALGLLEALRGGA